MEQRAPSHPSAHLGGAGRTVAIEGRASGHTTLAGLATEEEVEAVLRACLALAKEPGGALPRDKWTGGTRHLAALHERVPLVAELVRRSRLLDALGSIGATGLVLEEVSLRSPTPGFGAQRLHADDLPKLDRAPPRVATAIVALCEFTADNGATRVVPGSHRRPDLQRRAGSLESHPEEMPLLGPAGTAFVFSGHLLHAGGRNGSLEDRPALQVLWRLPGVSGPATPSSK